MATQGLNSDGWVSDPCLFTREVLIDPVTGQPFILYPAEEKFLREVFRRTPDGRLAYPEAVFSAPKKSGKSTLAAMAMLYAVVVLGGRNGEGIVLANDREQATDRIFQAISKIVEASPRLRKSAKITTGKIEFISSGATIVAIASDASSAAGSNPTYICADEIWGFTSERAQRLLDEVIPSPARKVSGRLITSYAGYSGESEALERLYKRGLGGEEIAPSLYAQPGLLVFWSTKPVAPWQTAGWLAEMRALLRRNAFLRMIENQFVTSEDTFVEMQWYDACIDPELRPGLGDRRLPLWVGVDASVKRDSTGIAAVTFDVDKQRVRLICHRIFQPSPDDPLDFEATIEAYLRDLAGRFSLREVRFDPYQMAAVEQRLTKAGLPMVEFAQTIPNLTEASTNLYELVKGRNLVVYPDDDLRLAISQAVALETARGWKISKEKASHKIDIVVALAMAALGALRGGAREWTAADSTMFQQVAQQMRARRRLAARVLPGAMIDNVNDMIELEDGFVGPSGQRYTNPGRFSRMRGGY
jgi:Phage Terminase